MNDRDNALEMLDLWREVSCMRVYSVLCYPDGYCVTLEEYGALSADGWRDIAKSEGWGDTLTEAATLAIETEMS